VSERHLLVVDDDDRIRGRSRISVAGGIPRHRRVDARAPGGNARCAGFFDLMILDV